MSAFWQARGSRWVDHGRMAIALGAEDLAILRLEDGPLVGHTCKVVTAAGELEAAELARRIAARLKPGSPLAMRLGGTPAGTAWVEDPEFDAAAHVHEGDGRGTPLGEQELRSEVARLFVARLDRSRPLWRIDLLALDGGRTALVWRIHHALADGVTAMRYASELLWDEPAAPAGGAARPPAAEERRRRAHLARFFAREFARSSSPFDATASRRRQVAFAALPLPELRAAAHRLAGASINDALLCVVGGAVREWIEHHHGHLQRLRVKVPVSLHHEGEQTANSDSFFVVGVPLEHVDPVARLRAVHAATAARKSAADAQEMDDVLRRLRAHSPRMAELCERLERSGRAFALNVSNVPGPRAPVSVAGAPVAALHSLAEIAQHHALRVAAVSLCDVLHLGLCADAGVIADVDFIALACEREAQLLIDA